MNATTATSKTTEKNKIEEYLERNRKIMQRNKESISRNQMPRSKSRGKIPTLEINALAGSSTATTPLNDDQIFQTFSAAAKVGSLTNRSISPSIGGHSSTTRNSRVPKEYEEANEGSQTTKYSKAINNLLRGNNKSTSNLKMSASTAKLNKEQSKEIEFSEKAQKKSTSKLDNDSAQKQQKSLSKINS